MKPRGRGVSPARSVAAPLLNEENEFGGAEVSEVSHHSAGGESGKRVRQSVAAIRISRSRQVIAFGAGRRERSCPILAYSRRNVGAKESEKDGRADLRGGGGG